MSQLCVNNLPASKVTLISQECLSVISLESVSTVSSALHLVSGMECWDIKLCYFSNRQLGSSLVTVVR